ncbi:hypothetical protein, partial [Kordia sp.]|uniref:hypothetical protein n=1 Tax=Kordia sp. TaxID=1965332 RepID=UPI003D6B59AF
GMPDTGGIWSPALTSGTGIFDPTTDASGIYTYTINNGICGDVSAQVNVTVFSELSAGTNGVLEICTNDASVDLFDSLT